MSFDDLLAGLERARAGGAVNRRYDPPTGLSLWIYSSSCVYDDLWDEFSLMARGLILHEGRREVVATPFPKFFNAGERQGTTTDGTTTSGTTTNATVPDGPFEAFEKLDGSLVILFRFDGRWRTATKGAFASEQARWALTRLPRSRLRRPRRTRRGRDLPPGGDLPREPGRRSLPEAGARPSRRLRCGWFGDVLRRTS